MWSRRLHCEGHHTRGELRHPPSPPHAGHGWCGTILRALDKPDSLISFVTDRPGHDRRYPTNLAKLRTELQWRPGHDFDDAIAVSVEWYVTNQVWWARVSTEEYKRTNQLNFGPARNPESATDRSGSK